MTSIGPDVHPPRPAIAALLSAVVPGLGHWYLGRRRRSAWFALPFGLMVAAAIWLGIQGRIGLVEILVQPVWIITLAAANVGMAIFRCAAALDAFWLAGGTLRARGSMLVGAAVLALMIPHVVVGAYAADLLGLLRTVFVTDDSLTVAAAQAARYRGAPSQTIVPVPAEERGSILVLADGVLANQPDGIQRSVTPSFGEIPAPAMSPFDEEIGRITILLAGGDAGPGRVGLRTDVMVVATLDLSTHRAALFSVSRELVGFEMPSQWDQLLEDREQVYWNLARTADLNGTSQAPEPAPEVFEPTGIWPDRINAIYPYTQGLVDRYYPGSPDPSMDALADTLEIALGIPIPYWALVDMEGFVDLVDAIGGVDVTALEPMHVTFSPEREGAEMIRIDIEPGRVHLDGRLALAYVRNRSDSNDYVRTRRQRCLLREVAASVDALTILSNFSSITAAIRDHTTTNIPVRFLPDLVEAGGSLDRGAIVTMAFEASASHAPDSNYRGLRMIDPDRVRASVQAVLDGMDTGVSLLGTDDECL